MKCPLNKRKEEAMEKNVDGVLKKNNNNDNNKKKMEALSINGERAEEMD